VSSDVQSVREETGLAGSSVRAVLTDIEGTTTSLSFVRDVLFPYARRYLPEYVQSHRAQPRIVVLLEEVRHYAQDRSLSEESVVSLLCRWIDDDKKITPLKTLQGYIWEEGYRRGAFQGHVYDDAAKQLGAWHAKGLSLHVFSSGSIEAQRLLFGHSVCGDLTPLFSGYFDTTTGPKNAASSYEAIASRIGLVPHGVLFLSDTITELDAARTAGMVTTLLNRDGPPTSTVAHPQVRTFEDIDPMATTLLRTR
jgi:enolase-phosphatase E1